MVEGTESDFAGRGAIEIGPSGIHAFDQPDFPSAVPALQCFLALNGFGDGGVLLEINEVADAIARGETRD